MGRVKEYAMTHLDLSSISTPYAQLKCAWGEYVERDGDGNAILYHIPCPPFYTGENILPVYRLRIVAGPTLVDDARSLEYSTNFNVYPVRVYYYAGSVYARPKWKHSRFTALHCLWKGAWIR